MDSFYLAVWHSGTAISDDEAARQYFLLSDGESAPGKFDSQVYAFYSFLTDLYPEIDMVAESDIDACPWACAIEMAGGHAVMAIRPEEAGRLVP